MASLTATVSNGRSTTRLRAVAGNSLLPPASPCTALLHLVGEIATGCCRWKWLALFAIDLNCLFNDLTQLLENRLFVIAVGPAIYQTWGAAHIAMIFL